MKKILSLLIALVLVLGNIAMVSAAPSDVSTGSDRVVHELGISSPDGVEVITPQGTSEPRLGHSWDLDDGAYKFSFKFQAHLYTNYTLITNTGKIKFTITSKPDLDTKNKTFELELRKKNLIGSTHVKTITCKRDGKTSKSFTGLSSSNEYFLSFDKEVDGVTLIGAGSVTQ